MKRLFWCISLAVTCLFVSGTMTIKAQSYSKLWEQAGKEMGEGLPKSTIRTVQSIFAKAGKEHNAAQQLKAGTTLIMLREDLSPDSVADAISSLESLSFSAPQERALQHYFLAREYNKVRQSWSLRRNLTLQEEYLEKAQQHLKAALADKQMLSNTSIKSYAPLYTMGKDSKIYDNDFLSILIDDVCGNKMEELLNGMSLTADSVVNGSSIEGKWRLHSEVAEIYKKKGNREAYILQQISALNAQNSILDTKFSIPMQDYAKALRTLGEENKSSWAGAEAMLAYMNAPGTGLSSNDRVALARESYKTWRKARVANAFLNIENELLRPSVRLSMDSKANACTPTRFIIRHQNTDNATLHVTGDTTIAIPRDFGTRDPKWVQPVAYDTLFLSLNPGKYNIYLTAPNATTDTIKAHLSSLYTFTISRGNKLKVSVVNCGTNAPVENADVTMTWTESYKPRVDKSITLKTDAQGIVTFDAPEKGTPNISVSYGSRNTTNAFYASVNTGYFYRERPDNSYQLYSDRAIYRPGQKVMLSGFVFWQDGDSTTAVAGLEDQIQVRDANGRAVGSKDVVSDRFGNAYAEFTLPTDRLNGTYSASFGDCTIHFRVEEYKRPNFHAEFIESEDAFAIGDSITVSAKALTYSGIPVQNATVQWNVSCTIDDFWTLPRWRESTAIAHGESITDENGVFTLPLSLTTTQHHSQYDVLSFNISANFTDMAGETHTAKTVVRVADQPFALTTEVKENIDADTEPFIKVATKAVNANGKAVQKSGKWELQAYAPAAKDKWEGIATGSFISGDTISIPITKEMQRGSYYIVCKADYTSNVTQKEKTVEGASVFTLWASKRRGKMVLKDDWYYTPSENLKKGTPADIWMCHATPSAYTYVYVQNHQKFIEEHHSWYGDTIAHLQISDRPEFDNGMLVTIQRSNGQALKEHSLRYTRPVPEKALKMEWTSFRDHLTPGQRETWTIRITDPSGKPANAQLIATLYDASLEAFAKHSWPFSIAFPRRSPYSNSSSMRTDYYNDISLRFPFKRHTYRSLKFNSLFDAMEMPERKFRNSRLALGGAPVVEAKALVERSFVEDKEMMSNKLEAGQDEEQQIPADIRSNFSETAFFMPHLQTDSKGIATLKFTIPESLTQWNFMGLAHTEDMDYGQLTGTAYTQKRLMVQPNMPRFVREGDKFTIAATISNQTEKTINGKARLLITDGATGKTLYDRSVSVGAKAKGSTVARFEVGEMPNGTEQLICEISATDGTATDGERHILPILPASEVLFETIPFYLEGQSKRTIDLSQLFNGHSPSATQKSLNIDYTDAPAWNAILALTTLTTPENSSIVSWANSLYANTAARNVARSIPNLETLLQEWKSEASGETLSSELEGNEELRKIQLQETPWVLDAANEKAQRQQLTNLFDASLLTARTTKARSRVINQQQTDGGWGWFEGMRSNPYITLMVVRNLARIQALPNVAADEALNRSMHRGLDYLDNYIKEHWYENLHKDKNNLPGETILEWLSLSEQTNHESTVSHINSFRKDCLERVAAHFTELSMYGRAEMTATFAASGKKKDAERLVRSLKEYMVEKEGEGRYFDTQRALYSWTDYRLSTHLAAMRALWLTKDAFSDNVKQLRDMQLWLLRQKQSQHWDTPTNTLAAADLLLTVDGETNFRQGTKPVLSIDGQNIAVGESSAGLGRSLTEVPERLVYGKSLLVNKQSEGISWGAVFARYNEQSSNVASYGQGLTITRRIMRAVATAEGDTWEPVAEGTTLKVGDRLRIRLDINSDRDMDFVNARLPLPACLESQSLRSGYQLMGARWGYLSLHDSHTDAFFDTFRKGTASIDLDYFVVRAGTFTANPATVQCSYAPQYTGHTEGGTLKITER